MKHEVTVYWVDHHCSYHIPDIRIVTCEPLQLDKQSELIIKLCNPSQHQTTVQFLPLHCAEDDLEEREKEIEKKISTEERDAQVNCQAKWGNAYPCRILCCWNFHLVPSKSDWSSSIEPYYVGFPALGLSDGSGSFLKHYVVLCIKTEQWIMFPN